MLIPFRQFNQTLKEHLLRILTRIPKPIPRRTAPHRPTSMIIQNHHQSIFRQFLYRIIEYLQCCLPMQLRISL